MALKVGTLGIPKFLKFFKILSTQIHKFDTDELPIDIDLSSVNTTRYSVS